MCSQSTSRRPPPTATTDNGREGRRATPTHQGQEKQTAAHREHRTRTLYYTKYSTDHGTDNGTPPQLQLFVIITQPRDDQARIREKAL
jgi:hypothetical protein